MIVYDYKIVNRVTNNGNRYHGLIRMNVRVPFTLGHFRIYCNCCGRGLKVFIDDTRILSFWADGSWGCRNYRVTIKVARYFLGKDYRGNWVNSLLCPCGETLLSYLEGVGGGIIGGSHRQKYTLRMTPCTGE